ncbi:MAG: acyl carrier protein [Cellvibrionaceae bacterium]
MSDLEHELKELIIEALDLEDVTVDDIETNEPLFIEGLGLDSIDALELGLALKNKYGVKLEADGEDTKKYFASVKTLAEFVVANQK